MRIQPTSILACIGGFLVLLCTAELAAQVVPSRDPQPPRTDALRTQRSREPAQPPAPPDPAETAPSPAAAPEPELLRTNPFAGVFSRQSRRTRRLVPIPDMFGDFFTGGQMTGDSGPDLITSDLPLAGASRRAKAAEHNKAFTEDRAYLTYHHFHNALEVDTAAGIVPEQSSHVDRYTFAFERTVGEFSSIEVRVPFTAGFDYTDPAFRMDGGEVGDLALLWKSMLYECDCSAASVGLTVTVPTGSDVRGAFPLLGTTFEVANHAVHLAPYLAYSEARERMFFHAFAQLDFAANGNRVAVDDTLLGLTPVGRLNDQTLLYLDLSAGYWLYEEPCAEGITGLAGLIEFHYTTTMQDADTVGFPGLTAAPSFGGVDNRFDVANLTAGLHLETAFDTAVRVAGVFPLSTVPGDRFFSSEFQIAVIRRF